MRRMFIAIALVASLISLSGCGNRAVPGVPGSGVSKSETRAVTVFQVFHISAAAAIDVTVSADASITDGKVKLEITADDNLLPLISTRSSGETIVIEPSQPIQPKTPIAVKVTTPALARAELNGAISGSIAGVTGNDFKLTANGAVNLKIAGTTQSLTITANGASRVNAIEFASAEIAATCNGTGHLELTPEKTLRATINGAGSITYTGEPAITKSINGVGSISKRK